MTDLPMPYGPPITLAAAARVMAAAEAACLERGWPMVIAIVDSGGHLVMLHRGDQAQLGSIVIAQAKAETAVNFRRATKDFQDIVATGGTGLRLLGAPGMLPMEGGVPIVADGKIIGAIGVSGMKSSEDAEIARIGIAAIATNSAAG